jgi:predicted membrane-bound spermidine synthase
LKTVSGNYSADLFGSAAGGLLVTFFLFPVSGIIFTGLFLGMLNLLGAFFLFSRHRNFVPL